MALNLNAATVSFGRGKYEYYNASSTPNLIYFATDKKVICVGGVAYGLSDEDAAKLNNAVKDVTLADNTLTVTYTSGKEASLITLTASNVKMDSGKTVEEAVTANDTAIKAEATRAKAAEEANANAIATLNGGDTVEGSVAKSIKDAIEALDVAEVGGDGKVITTISEADGKISAAAIDLKASNVAATATTATNDKVAVEGTNVEAQIASLAKSIKGVSTAAKSYSMSAITGNDLTALGTNVKEAYKLVDEAGTLAGDVIKIYKDSSLKQVVLNGQSLDFTYTLADGNESTVGVDVSTFLAESEFKNGLEVVDHVVNVKVDGTSESFLTVSADGVKVSGVQAAINTAAAKATTVVEEKAGGHVKVAKAVGVDGHAIYTVTEDDIASAALLGTASDDSSKATAFGKIAKEVSDRAAAITALNADVDSTGGTHVSVNVVESAGKVTSVTVSEDDIASAADLTAEVTRAKAAEDKIEAAVGLAADGSHITATGTYTSGATTIAGEIAALDALVKKNSDAIAASLIWYEGLA